MAGCIPGNLDVPPTRGAPNTARPNASGPNASDGYAPDTIIRPLEWSCPSEDALAVRFETRGHYREAPAPARWDSEAAHHAY
ncbi:hypothetical protein [Nocardiopsis sp. CC223A]|uniref:hypothetical protein n=1 Tax=Nocardiopsis sp. CC223A TaxID=3044051 RepID=UPI00278C5085|nr:hypothetical protein [Nocardiopsis sp. CC223A]